MDYSKFKKVFLVVEENDDGTFGHSPSHLVSVNRDGTTGMMALHHLSINEIITAVKTAISREPLELYLTIDFSSNAEIKNDYICSCYIKSGLVIQCDIVEYDKTTGEVIKTSDGKFFEAGRCVIDLIER